MTVMPSTLRPAPTADGEARFAPYASFRFPIGDFDYVEEEWIASGVEDADTYETTVLVRLPRDRSRFSGTVLVEPLHVHGIAPMSHYSSTYVMRSGHGWVDRCTTASLPRDSRWARSVPAMYRSCRS